MSVLLFDLGNSRLKWRLQPAHDLGDQSFDHSVGLTATIEHVARVWGSHAISQVRYCSVAAAQLTDHLLAQIHTLFPDAGIVQVRARARLGTITNGYDDPHSLGADRLIAMVGARSHLPVGAILLATLGTATTIDAIDADGAFDGGVILPGAKLMLRALAEGTAQLPATEFEPIGALGFARDTFSAMRSGVTQAQAGAIERLYRLALSRYGQVHCVLSGGAAEQIATELPFACRVIDNLVLDGLSVLTDEPA